MKPVATEAPTRRLSPSFVASDKVDQNKPSKKWLIGAAVVLVCMIATWGWGFSLGRAEVAPQRAMYEDRLVASEARLGEAEGQLKTTRDELTSSRSRARLLEARVLLFRAAIELEKRNFGIANKRLHSAADELKNLPASDSANSALLVLQREIAAANLIVATDVEQQRTYVLGLGERLDRLTPLASSE